MFNGETQRVDEGRSLNRILWTSFIESQTEAGAFVCMINLCLEFLDMMILTMNHDFTLRSDPGTLKIEFFAVS